MTTWIASNRFQAHRPAYLTLSPQNRFQLIGLPGQGSAVITEISNRRVSNQVVNPFRFSGPHRPIPFADPRNDRSEIRTFVYEPYSGRIIEYTYRDGRYDQYEYRPGPSMYDSVRNTRSGDSDYHVHLDFDYTNRHAYLLIPRDTQNRPGYTMNNVSYNVWTIDTQSGDVRLMYTPTGQDNEPSAHLGSSICRIGEGVFAIFRIIQVGANQSELIIQPFSVVTNRWTRQMRVLLGENIRKVHGVYVNCGVIDAGHTPLVSLTFAGYPGSYMNRIPLGDVGIAGLSDIRVSVQSNPNLIRIHSLYSDRHSNSIWAYGSKSPRTGQVGPLRHIWHDNFVGVDDPADILYTTWDASEISLNSKQTSDKRPVSKRKYKSLYATLLQKSGAVGPGAEVKKYTVKFSDQAMAHLAKVLKIKPPSREVLIQVHYRSSVVMVRIPNGTSGWRTIPVDINLWNSAFVNRENIADIRTRAPVLEMFRGAFMKRNSSK